MKKNSFIDRLKTRIDIFLHIRELSKLRKYDEIFKIYGSKEYIKATPSKIMIEDIQDLLKQGRYEDIYIRYGENTYNSHLIEMRKIDEQTEMGRKLKRNMEHIKLWLKIKFAPIVLSVGLLSPTIPVMASVLSRNLQRQNSIEYSEEIEKYNESIDAYAEKIRQLNLTDRQIFVKLMYDLWKEIDGYKTPEKYDVLGYHRLSVKSKEIGKCRNFSDHLVAELNAINPKYHARNLVVRLQLSEYQLMDIERKILEDDAPNFFNEAVLRWKPYINSS